MRRVRVKREGVSCYRLYDADMPEYSFAIDRYEVSNERYAEFVRSGSYPPGFTDRTGLPGPRASRRARAHSGRRGSSASGDSCVAPEADRPPDEKPDPDYDPWAAFRD